MKASPKAPRVPRIRRDTYTEQDVCNYAHHLWIQSGMSFDGDPWAEARACLAAHLRPAREPAAVARWQSPRPRRGSGLAEIRTLEE